MINEVFPDAVVLQDVKHLVNRLVEKLSKKSDAYGAACKSLHHVICGGTTTVRSRTNELCKIDAKLLEPDIILRNLNNWVNEYKLVAPDLFLAEFEQELKNQKRHIEIGCVRDPLIDDKHYIETTDGKFILLRGTNRNESLHRRLNNIWPDQCGQDLAAAIKTVFFFHWTSTRLSRPCSWSAPIPESDTASLVDLLKVRCPVQLGTASLVPLIKKYDSGMSTFTMTTASGNNAGKSTVVRKGVDKQFGRMDTTRGSKRSSYTRSDGPATKLVRVESVQTAPDPDESQGNPPRMSWNTVLTHLLCDIVENIDRTGSNISWAAVLSIWKTRTRVIATRKQLKARWQQLAISPILGSSGDIQITQHAIETSTITPSRSCGTLAASTTNPGIGSFLRPKAAISSTSSSTENTTSAQTKKHAFDSSRYTLDELSSIAISEARPGTRFSETENEIFMYVLLNKMKWKQGQNIKWSEFQDKWITPAKVARMANPHASIWLRTKDQLEEKWKTTFKKRFSA